MIQRFQPMTGTPLQMPVFQSGIFPKNFSRAPIFWITNRPSITNNKKPDFVRKVGLVASLQVGQITLPHRANLLKLLDSGIIWKQRNHYFIFFLAYFPKPP